MAKRGTLSSISFTNHPNLEQIIQRHPSPIVPVWIGSFYDDDGLDDSVVGDLVIIVGEIVTEYCADCHQTTSFFKIAGTLGTPPYSGSLHRRFPPFPFLATVLVTLIFAVLGCYPPPTSPSPLPDFAAATLAATSNLAASLSIPGPAPPPCAPTNGTDMSLLRESLRARRAYLAERKRQMEYLMPDHKIIEGLYSVGWGPPG